MHTFLRQRHRSAGGVPGKETKGLILNQGWRRDFMIRLIDTSLFHGQLRELRLRTAGKAHVQPGEAVLDVGCGTGTLAMEVQRRVGATCHVVGIDPSGGSIAHARSKATRRNMPVDFQIGVIEQLTFPDQTFDVVLSTLMMHHLPADLKRRGLAEIARVLKPGGRMVIADFKRTQDRERRAARFHAGGSSMHDLAALAKDAGFDHLETEELRPTRFSVFPGAGIMLAHKREREDPMV